MTCKNFFTQNPGALMRNLKLTHLGNAKRSDSLFQGIYWGEIVSDAANIFFMNHFVNLYAALV